MVCEKITKLSGTEFRERSDGKKVILLYPWTTYRTLFLTHFVSEEDIGLLYYRIADGEASLTNWLTAMAREFDEILPGFSAGLMPAVNSGKPEMMGEALAAGLAAYHDERTVLFVDEFDRLPFDSFLHKFIRALVAALPNHVQLAISSRLLTYQPWYDLIAQGEAIVFGTETRKDDVMFTVEERPRPQLEVYSLGRGHALVNGQPISNWDGALPRNLFFYFMDHHLVTRDQIFATFWPDLSVKEATNVFHVTKRKISERISMKVDENGGSYELTQYSGGFYVPSDKVIRHYDVGDFQSALEQAMITSDDAVEERLLMQAISLYKAPFLQNGEMPWMIERRDALRQMFAQALISMGRLKKRQQDLDTALGFFIRALKETPEREDIHREVMNIYFKTGRIQDARLQYRLLTDILRIRLNIGPSRESQELYALIEAAGA